MSSCRLWRLEKGEEVWNKHQGGWGREQNKDKMSRKTEGPAEVSILNYRNSSLKQGEIFPPPRSSGKEVEKADCATDRRLGFPQDV